MFFDVVTDEGFEECISNLGLHPYMVNLLLEEVSDLVALDPRAGLRDSPDPDLYYVTVELGVRGTLPVAYAYDFYPRQIVLLDARWL